MGKLTKVQKDVLAVFPDWSAPYEVADRLGRKRLLGVGIVLRRLKRGGLLEYGAPNNTYRITDAGRQALSLGAKQ